MSDSTGYSLYSNVQINLTLDVPLPQDLSNKERKKKIAPAY